MLKSILSFLLHHLNENVKVTLMYWRVCSVIAYVPLVAAVVVTAFPGCEGLMFPSDLRLRHFCEQHTVE